MTGRRSQAGGAAWPRIALAAIIICSLAEVGFAAPTATLQGTDDHDTAWRVGNLGDRLALLENQAQAGQHDLFKANCRHMDDTFFTIKNRLTQVPDGDQVKIFISHSPVAAARAALDDKKQQKQALIDTGVQYNQAIGEIDQKIAAGVNKFQLDWLKALFTQLKPATGLPKVYEIPTEFWDWYQDSAQQGQDLTNDLNTVQKLSKLRDALREKQREVLDRAQAVTAEVDAEEPKVAELEQAFDTVVAKYPFVVVGNAPATQPQQAPELSICFLVDCSGSMDGGKIEAARAAIRSSVGGTDDGKTEWALLGFGACNLWEEIGFTQTAADLTAAADGLSTGGDTPLTFSMYKALTYVASEGQGRTRRLIILCDGQDNCSERGSTSQEDAMAGLRTIVRDVPGGTQP
ncbi:MAG: VWA domain-containing protein [Armatimonadia bacterium]|nr:VWA domain-containing protein [Armatimonadia bacterium]